MFLYIHECTFFDENRPSVGLQVTTNSIKTSAMLTNCWFSQGLSLSMYASEESNATILDTVFSNILGTGVQISTENVFSKSICELRNVSFVQNHVNRGVIFISSINTTLSNCSFASNQGDTAGALNINDANVFFTGSVSFFNNTGMYGGAIYMSGSRVWIERDTYITFINNTAIQKGGAIFVAEICQQAVTNEVATFDSNTPCFYQLLFDVVDDLDTLPAGLIFENNSAVLYGGNEIYGDGLQKECVVHVNSDNEVIRSLDIYNHLFNFYNINSTLSLVSSCPKRVCLCENGTIPRCIDIGYIFQEVLAAPGSKFKLSMALVGDDFGTVTGNVYALGINSNFSFTPGEELQKTAFGGICTTLEYSLHLKAKEIKAVAFLLSTSNLAAATQRALLDEQFTREKLTSFINDYFRTGIIEPNLLYAPVIVNVTILPCPLGFELAGENADYVCHCENDLIDYTNDCTQENNTGVFYRHKTNWIGAVQLNSSFSIIASKLCPLGYCKPYTVGVSLDHPDSQCALNHSGILCGGCPPGLSLAIGSSRCIQCPNNNGVALILVFILAGIGLVLFIKIFNLTVAHGTINGLIFYANVIWINQGSFFSIIFENINIINPMLINFFNVLKGFIAWLNLDFGIEACFIQGLDAYWKTWLQLVFPAYILLLAGLIVVVCHYSTKATRLFGNNAVAVLATIVLMSYMKLLRNIVTVFGFSIVEQFHPRGFRVVWLLDGNVQYFMGKHAALFIVTFLVCLVWILYTIMLLFLQPIHKLCCDIITSRLVRIKPFLDTYTGPLKDKHQYWIGLTLFARFVLGVIAIAVEGVKPSVSVVLLGITSAILCILLRGVYKAYHIFALELWFLLHLVILCFAFFAADNVEAKVVLMCISISISFLTFLAIVSYPMFAYLSRKCGFCTRPRNGYTNIDAYQFDQSNRREQQSTESEVTTTVVDSPWRECILDDEVSHQS